MRYEGPREAQVLIARCVEIAEDLGVDVPDRVDFNAPLMLGRLIVAIHERQVDIEARLTLLERQM